VPPRSAPGRAAIPLLASLAAGGCGDTPVPATRPSLIEQAQRLREERAPTKYERKEGLHVDVPYLVGREYASLAPDVVEDQLGKLTRRAAEPDGQVVMEFEKAELRLWRGRIFYLRYPFPAPMDRRTAYGVCGFPLEMGPTIEATLEVRVNNFWGMRRISLRRVAADAPQFKQIEVWKSFPKTEG